MAATFKSIQHNFTLFLIECADLNLKIEKQLIKFLILFVF